MLIEELTAELGKNLFERLFQLRKAKPLGVRYGNTVYTEDAPGWLTVAEFLADFICPAGEWAKDPNVISIVEMAIGDIDKAVALEFQDPPNRQEKFVEHLRQTKAKLVVFLKANGLGMLEVCK